MNFNLDKAVSIWIPYKEREERKRQKNKKRLREEETRDRRNRDSEESSAMKRYQHILWPSEISNGESKDAVMAFDRKEQDDLEQAEQAEMPGEPHNAKDYANLFEFSMHRLEIPPDTRLAPDFVPGPYDVICQRGSPSFKHEGNITFRKLIAKCYGEYLSCNTKLSKTIAISAIIEKVRRLSPKGGFIKFHKKKDCWVEVGDRKAHEKVGHALREIKYFAMNNGSRFKTKQNVLEPPENLIKFPLPKR